MSRRLQTTSGLRRVLTRLLEQREQLTAELLSPEREQLDQDDARAVAAVGVQDHLPAQVHRPLEAAPAVAADQRPVGRQADRRQRHHLDIPRQRDVPRDAAAAEQDEPEPLRERPGEGERPRQVAEPERVLAVEEECGTIVAHVTPASVADAFGGARQVPRGAFVAVGPQRPRRAQGLRQPLVGPVGAQQRGLERTGDLLVAGQECPVQLLDRDRGSILEVELGHERGDVALGVSEGDAVEVDQAEAIATDQPLIRVRRTVDRSRRAVPGSGVQRPQLAQQLVDGEGEPRDEPDQRGGLAARVVELRARVVGRRQEPDETASAPRRRRPCALPPRPLARRRGARPPARRRPPPATPCGCAASRRRAAEPRTGALHVRPAAHNARPAAWILSPRPSAKTLAKRTLPRSSTRRVHRR